MCAFFYLYAFSYFTRVLHSERVWGKRDVPSRIIPSRRAHLSFSQRLSASALSLRTADMQQLNGVEEHTSEPLTRKRVTKPSVWFKRGIDLQRVSFF